MFGIGLGALCGYSGIIASVAYSVLQHFHLTEFSPVVDAIFQVACPIGAAKVLHNSEPPAK